jgi:Protein of unknown function (DUF2786)
MPSVVRICTVRQVIEHLPALHTLGGIKSRPSQTTSHEQQRLFTRIRGLLTKAELSDFAEEAEAFMTKAQELMTRYCIDRTMVEAGAEGGGGSQVDSRRVWAAGPAPAVQAELGVHDGLPFVAAS